MCTKMPSVCKKTSGVGWAGWMQDAQMAKGNRPILEVCDTGNGYIASNPHQSWDICYIPRKPSAEAGTRSLPRAINACDLHTIQYLLRIKLGLGVKTRHLCSEQMKIDALHCCSTVENGCPAATAVYIIALADEVKGVGAAVKRLLEHKHGKPRFNT